MPTRKTDDLPFEELSLDDADGGIERIEKQRPYGPTFWCGQAGCGHQTIEEAKRCWRDYGNRVGAMEKEFARLLSSGEGYETVVMGRIVVLPHAFTSK